jgi:hypothetical protein
MKYMEIGYGNPTFVSTELENENRLSRRVSGKVASIYVRVWIGRLVLILDSVEGLKIKRKERNEIKCLVGVVLR